jgi:hypothetical protein
MSDNEFYEEEVVSEVEEDDIIQHEDEESVTETEKGSDYIYDQVKGGHGKKHVLSDLNKKRLGNHEMDELFCNWY